MVKKRTKKLITLTGFVGFFLALALILDPYVFLEIGTGITLKINDIFMMILGFLCFNKFFNHKIKTSFLIFLTAGLTLITIVANKFSGTNFASSLKNLFVWVVYAVLITYIWKTPCRDEFFKWINRIAVFATIIVFLQFVLGTLGFPMWDGRLSFLKLGKYDGWAGYIDPNTADIRPNSIFQEPSYLGVYLSVAYVFAFKEGKIKTVILYVAAMILTTSIVSIVLCAVTTLYLFVKQRKLRIPKKIISGIIALGFIAILTGVMLFCLNESIRKTVTYIFKRFTRLGSDLSGERMSSAKYRLLGYSYLFKDYNLIQMLVGVGVGQFSSYWGVASYSNVVVTTLLNSGVLGIILLFTCVFWLFFNIKRENRVFWIILVLVFFCDYQWFSWYFFYLISACVLVNKKDYNKRISMRRELKSRVCGRG